MIEEVENQDLDWDYINSHEDPEIRDLVIRKEMNSRRIRILAHPDSFIGQLAKSRHYGRGRALGDLELLLEYLEDKSKHPERYK